MAEVIHSIPNCEEMRSAAVCIWDVGYQVPILQGHLHQQGTGFPDEGALANHNRQDFCYKPGFEGRPCLPRTMVTSLSHTVGRLGPETALP